MRNELGTLEVHFLGNAEFHVKVSSFLPFNHVIKGNGHSF